MGSLGCILLYQYIFNIATNVKLKTFIKDSLLVLKEVIVVFQILG